MTRVRVEIEATITGTLFGASDEPDSWHEVRTAPLLLSAGFRSSVADHVADKEAQGWDMAVSWSLKTTRWEPFDPGGLL